MTSIAPLFVSADSRPVGHKEASSRNNAVKPIPIVIAPLLGQPRQSCTTRLSGFDIRSIHNCRSGALPDMELWPSGFRSAVIIPSSDSWTAGKGDSFLPNHLKICTGCPIVAAGTGFASRFGLAMNVPRRAGQNGHFKGDMLEYLRNLVNMNKIQPIKMGTLRGAGVSDRKFPPD
jgi:hypothetical protein